MGVVKILSAGLGTLKILSLVTEKIQGKGYRGKMPVFPS